ncbi:uncharacterized protein [Dermacentor andersoni]|uniref:uncharacterized protein isoform X2 n=1 Tax=Dermacentor andersoni TaxID=34620 RepID=UPI002417C7DB|nr:uncharacterized protein LOC126539468 isoform X2 [Dermacentor andersoni]XP_054931381.1 uncharacterized protein LOC126539468 isoform X2 [Dermacentor andersoni]
MRPLWVNQLCRCKVLVVNEVSTLHGCFCHKLEPVARLVCCSDRPINGIQLVLCGGFLQLPPVSRKEEPALVFCFQVLLKLSVAGPMTSATCRLAHCRNEMEAFHVTCLTFGCSSCAWPTSQTCPRKLHNAGIRSHCDAKTASLDDICQTGSSSFHKVRGGPAFRQSSSIMLPPSSNKRRGVVNTFEASVFLQPPHLDAGDHFTDTTKQQCSQRPRSTPKATAEVLYQVTTAEERGEICGKRSGRRQKAGSIQGVSRLIDMW